MTNDFGRWVEAVRALGPYRETARRLSADLQRIMETPSPLLSDLDRLRAEVRTCWSDLDGLEKDAPEHVGELKARFIVLLNEVDMLRENILAHGHS